MNITIIDVLTVGAAAFLLGFFSGERVTSLDFVKTAERIMEETE